VPAPEHFPPISSTVTSQTPVWPALDCAPWRLERLTAAYTDWVLRETAGDKPRAARILDIDVSTLYRWRRAHR
jgi:DNA-binding NtrC family response regulator